MLDRLSLPVKIGLGFGLLGIFLTVIGIFRGNVPLNPASIAIALLIGGGVWFVVAWAVATAAVDVEREA
jgi:drug/metabolite transporter (DMT)-like permease